MLKCCKDLFCFRKYNLEKYAKTHNIIILLLYNSLIDWNHWRNILILSVNTITYYLYCQIINRLYFSNIVADSFKRYF